jgi:large subunit ribosomal protein L28
MPKCKITGKKPLVGYRVSHAHNKTKMRQQPNVQSKRVWDDDQGKYVRVRVSTRALRTIEKNGLSTVLKSVR